MLRFLVLLFVIQLLEALSPPPGVVLKPAKQLDGKDEGLSSPPPNLSLRSRMMAAINVEKTDKPLLMSQPLILKRKKLKNYTKEIKMVPTATPRSLHTSTISLPPSADYGVTSLLKTNFVDKKGKVHQDMIAVPIRVGTKIVSSSSALVEGEGAKGVQVRFGPAPLGARK